MFTWLKRRLQAGRIASWNAQLASELGDLTPVEVASVLVKGMDFAMSFRQHENGFVVSKAIEEPSKHLASDGARELYGQLEEILLTAQAQAGPMLAGAKESLAPVQHAVFARSVELNHISLRLLMLRVARVINAADAQTITQVTKAVRGALPCLGVAVKQFEQEQRATGVTAVASHYTFLRDMAYNYAVTYPA